MLIELSIFWTATLNVVGWLAIQLGLAWVFLRLPAAWFDAGLRPSDRRGRKFYERILRIKLWKDRLPDAARWFGGGFAKGVLAEKHSAYLRRFVAETRRGEICHWLAMACVPLFGVWNPWWGVLVNAAYAVLANLPCVLAQRYNRSRLLAVLARRS